MPRSQNPCPAASASAADWATLLATAAVEENVHHVKACCLDWDPSRSSTVKLLCFSASGVSLDIGSFLCEDNLQAVFPRFSPVAQKHAVLEVIFFEDPDEEDHEGVILGVKDELATMSAANVLALRERFGE